jgi:3-hydroxybutyryl-CoA dehydrogenase
MGAAIAGLWAAAGSDVCVTTSHRTVAGEALRRVDCDGVTWARSATDAADGASFVIEALPEVLDLKQHQLSVAQEAAQQAILMTNTSSLCIRDIAVALERPEQLVGAHFFNPPNLIRVVEVVDAETSSGEAIAAAETELRRIGQRPIRVKRDSPGFITNRLQFALLREAVALVQQGIADPEDVDRIVSEGLGPRWAGAGPFATVALGGPQLFEDIATTIYPVLSNEAEPNGSLASISLMPDRLEAARSQRAGLLAGFFQSVVGQEGADRHGNTLTRSD